jgi:hypothetical protein
VIDEKTAYELAPIAEALELPIYKLTPQAGLELARIPALPVRLLPGGSL